MHSIGHVNIGIVFSFIGNPGGCFNAYMLLSQFLIGSTTLCQLIADWLILGNNENAILYFNMHYCRRILSLQSFSPSSVHSPVPGT